LQCFIKSGHNEHEQEARAHLHVKEASRFEGLGTPSDIKQACRERVLAGKLFAKLKMFYLAATQFQKAGLTLSSSELLLKAADNWERSIKNVTVARSLLKCLELAGVRGYSRLLSALEMRWIGRDEEYWRIFNAFADKYGEEASDSEVTRLASLFATFDEKIQFLEDLDKKTTVEQLLTMEKKWNRLALLYEERAELSLAKKHWCLAQRQDVLDTMEASEAAFSLWKQTHVQGYEADFLKLSSLGTVQPDTQNHLYYELLNCLSRCESWIRLVLSNGTAVPRNVLDVESAGVLLAFLSRCQARFPSFREYARHLLSGGFPETGDAEGLGLLKANYNEAIHFAAVCQTSIWKELSYAPGVGSNERKVPMASTLLAKCVGAFCKAVAKTLEARTYNLLSHLDKWSASLPDTEPNFLLRMGVKVSSA
jgi:hypothetical protein